MRVESGGGVLLVSWSVPGGGACEASGFLVRIRERSRGGGSGVGRVVAESLVLSGTTSWLVTGLTPGVSYTAEVLAYSAVCWSFSPAVTRTFTVTAAGRPPVPPRRPLMSPMPVQELKVDTGKPGRVTVTWTKPAATPDVQRDVRCAYTRPGVPHWVKTVRYAYEVHNVTTGERVGAGTFESAGPTLTRTVTLTGHAAGAGYRLRVSVVAYSETCKRWSAIRRVFWWTKAP